MVSDTLPPVSAFNNEPKKRSLSPQQLEKSLERLYTRSVNTLKDRMTEYNKSVEYQVEHNKLKKPPTGELSETEKKAIEHLYTQPLEKKKKGDGASARKTHQENGPVVKHVTQDEQDAIVDRLYSQAITMRNSQLDASTRRIYGDGSKHGKTLDKEGLASAVESLYTKAMERKKTSDAQLEEKYGWKKIESAKKITPEEAKALAERLQKSA